MTLLASLSMSGKLSSLSAAAPHPGGRLSGLSGRIWKVTDAANSQSAPGRIYIFLPNGTLLETSCVETYRVAVWSVQKQDPPTLKVVEGGQLAFTAVISELSDTTLKLRVSLRIGEENLITLQTVAAEFVCPDLPKR